MGSRLGPATSPPLSRTSVTTSPQTWRQRDNNMKLLNSIIILLFPLAGSFFRLPKWLYNPMKIVSHLPSTFLQIESRAKKTDLHSCESVITDENPVFSSPQIFHSQRCRAKIEINPKICNLRVKLTEFN